MDASPVNIIQYFDGTKQEIIPLFQRPYCWQQNNWEILWVDIMTQYEESERNSHFMGAIVTLPVKSVPVGVSKHLVIDGQQRLTTIALLLAAIRKKALECRDEKTAGIVGDLLINRYYKSPDDLKVVPTQSDRAAYNALIQAKPLKEYEETKIVQGYQFFYNKLSENDNNDRPLVPEKVLQTIQCALQVVMINLGENDDPYLIFESLNHKGVPLNQSDLVRNYVLMRFQHSTTAGGEQELVYEELWHPMEIALGESMTEFLRHFAMKMGRNVRKDEVYVASKSEFERLETTNEVRNSIQEMKAAAFAYNKFIQPDTEENHRLSKSFRAMKELDSTVFYPLLLRFYRGWEGKNYTQDDISKCLEILESFYVRRLVCSVPTNALNKIIMDLCQNLPTTNPIEWLKQSFDSGSSNRRWPSDTEFTNALTRTPLYPRRKIAQFVLKTLEDSFQHKEPVDSSKSTIEHIMPQTLTDQWRHELGENNKEIHEQWLDTLGNLTLTGYNSELSNLLFVEKKERLQNTHFELTRSILNENTWGQEQIEARAKQLALASIKCWPK
jgi:uncharacterized protein with ParB-like and HNH nuclease domain